MEGKSLSEARMAAAGVGSGVWVAGEEMSTATRAWGGYSGRPARRRRSRARRLDFLSLRVSRKSETGVQMSAFGSSSVP